MIDESVELEKPVSTTLIRVKNAYECVAKLLQMYESMKPKKTGIDPLAFVSPKAKVAEGVYVGALLISAMELRWAKAARFILMPTLAKVSR